MKRKMKQELKQMRICMIGVGLMGHGIAKNILRAGPYHLSFLDHAGNQPIDDLLAAGAVQAETLSLICPDADIILICVTGAPEVETVLFSDQGVFANAGKGQIVLDCSTSIPEKSRAFAKRLTKKQIRYIDAAMTRTPKEAEQGKLNLILGGHEGDIKEVMDLLGCFADKITLAGPVGSGHGLKLIHNYVSLGFAAILSEAAAAARSEAINTDILIDVLEAGGGKSVVLERFRPYLQDGDTSGLRFSLANAAKDIGYFNIANQSSHMASALHTLFKNAAADLGETETVLKLVEQLAVPKSGKTEN